MMMMMIKTAMPMTVTARTMRMKEFVGTDTKALDTKALTAQTLKEKGRNIGKACWEMQCDDENPDNDDDLYTIEVCLSVIVAKIYCLSWLILQTTTLLSAVSNIVGIFVVGSFEGSVYVRGF